MVLRIFENKNKKEEGNWMFFRFMKDCLHIHRFYDLINIHNMSFFNKLFGGEEKKKPAPAPAPKSEAEKIAEKKIKIEAALNDLDVKIQAFEEK
jgi:hypothetical protein